MNLLKWLSGRRGGGSLERMVRRQPSSRKVWLEMHDGKLVVADATLTDAGWVARWINSKDTWSLLLPDGKVRGTSLVIAWLPHTGWNEDVTMPPNRGF